jgi:flagellar M-ring protein FliF
MGSMLQNFRSASTGRQLALLAGLGAIVLALLVLAYFLWFRTTYAVLYTNLREADAATIVAELDRTHVDYRLDDDGRTILVPAGAVNGTRLRVAGQDLPLQGTVGFELFNNSSIGLTEFAQRINLQRALQGELARTIMSIDGVETARVHLSLGEQSVFRGDRHPPRASVAIRMQTGRRLNTGSVRGVQRLVAGSVPDLEPADVAVLNDRGLLISADLPGDAPIVPGTEEERSVERFFETRIRHALEGRFPSDAVQVNVWAAIGEHGDAGTATGAAAGAAPTPVSVPAADGAALPSRNYRIRATVAIASPLADAAREQVTQSVRDAIGYSDTLGDAVSVTVSPPIPAVAAWDQSAVSPGNPVNFSQASTPPAQSSSRLDALWLPAILLFLIGGILFLLRRRGPAQPMNEQERLAYVANLKMLLAQRDADVASPR